ncbi:RNA polymerase sigma factor [Planctomycetota bacterium]
MLSDGFLIWKFNRGSADALRRIYEKYRGTMLTVATALCHDVHTAEDVVQDCFISFARKSGQLSIQGSLKAYLTTSVVNRMRDHYRRSKSRPSELTEAEYYPCPKVGPETAVICNEQMLKLGGALANLTTELREVVVLRSRGGMTYQEISKIQDVSIPTVQRRYHSGLDKLRVLLNGELEK